MLNSLAIDRQSMPQALRDWLEAGGEPRCNVCLMHEWNI